MTELEVYQPPAAEVVLASDIDSWTHIASQVIRLAKEIYDTPFVPDGLRGSVPAVSAAILAGRELGLPPLTSLANIHVIKGKPSLSAALMRALIMAQGHQIESVSVTDTRVVIRGRRKGEASWEEASFTADQARQAKIDISAYPQDKLYARATSRLARRKFADVIAGMPYSAEDLEDGEAVEGTVAEAAPAIAAPAEKPRTAQRKPRPTNASPAQAAVPVAAAPPSDPPKAGAGEALPPLPGEEETPSGAAGDAAPGEPDDTDYDTPGTVTDPQVKAIVTILSKVFGVDSDEQSRAVCAHIAEREVTSRKNLSKNEAAGIIDTLSHWQKQAKKEGMEARTYMFALMAAQEAARAQDTGEIAGGGDGGE